MKKIYFLIKPVLLLVLVLSLQTAFAQDNPVTGKVMSQKEDFALPGVSVLVKGTTVGTITDTEGNYRLNVPANGTLVFSFIGYTTQEVSVGNRSVVDVNLLPDAKALDEVVVVGYGTQTQRNITGAVQTIKATELTDIPVPQIAQKLQGRFAGVQILQTTGRPGEGMSVRVRGQASISAGNQPLYVVDGFPVTGDISFLNPGRN